MILFIPIRRYTVGGGLPVELEPYRLLHRASCSLCWLFAVCADPAVRWRRTGLEAPILAVLVAILGSLALNVSRVNGVGELVLKQVTFFLTFFLVVYFVASVVERGPKLDRMLRLLAGGGTLLAVAVADRVAHRHEPLQRAAARHPVPPLRGLRRPHRARHAASARSARPSTRSRSAPRS